MIDFSDRTPPLSILMAVRNGSATLGKQLDALAPQLGSHTELILIDDASTDPSLTIAKSYAVKLRMTVLTEPSPLGKAAALNKALRIATGDSILILDQDDVVGTDYIAEMALGLSQHPFVSGRLEYELLNNSWLCTALKNMPNQDTAHVRLRNTQTDCDTLIMVAPGCVHGIKRWLLDKLGGFATDVGCTDDMDICIRAHLLGISYKRLDAAVLHYRLRESGTDLFRQRFGYGVSWAALYKKHRHNGMTRRRVSQIRNEMFTILAGIVGGRTGRLRALAAAGITCGRVYGSITHRVIYF